MAPIIPFSIPGSKLGYKRVRKRSKSADSANQLDLFPRTQAQILPFASPTPDLSPFEQALVSDEQGQEQAAHFYLRAIDQHDCVADAYCNLGIIESQNGNTLKAFDCFTTSLKHDPRHSEAHYNLGNLYFELNDFRLAQTHFEMAALVDPEFANAHFNLALVLLIDNDPSEALRALARYRELVSEEESRASEEIFRDLRQALATANERK